MWGFPASCCWMRQELRVQSWTPSTVLLTEVGASMTCKCTKQQVKSATKICSQSTFTSELFLISNLGIHDGDSQLGIGVL